MTKNTTQAFRACAFAVVSLPFFAHGAAALDTLTFQANWLIQGENAYMVAGRDKGFYKNEGIDLDIKRGFGSGDTIKKIATGAATVGTADMGIVMMSRVREGVPVKCISAEYTYLPLSFWVLESSGINSVKDLVGKRMGASPGTSIIVYWPLVAKANGIDPSSLSIVTMEGSALLPTLLAGKVDTMPGFATVFDLRNDEAKSQGKSMRMMPLAQNGLKVMGECQFVSEAALKDKPDLLQRYVRATQKSLRWSRDNPEETAKLVSVDYPELKEPSVLVNHKAYMNYVFNETSDKVGLGGFDMDQVQRTFDAMKVSQSLTASADVASFVDTRFLGK